MSREIILRLLRLNTNQWARLIGALGHAKHMPSGEERDRYEQIAIAILDEK